MVARRIEIEMYSREPRYYQSSVMIGTVPVLVKLVGTFNPLPCDLFLNCERYVNLIVASSFKEKLDVHVPYEIS